MRALVTGASGFVGQGLTATLVDAGWHVLRVSRRPMPSLPSDHATDFIGALDDTDRLAQAMTDVEVVVHLAGTAHRQILDQEKHVDDTVRLAQNAYEAAQIAQVGRFVYVSSIYARLAEDGLLEGQMYGAAKRQAEQTLFDLAGEPSAPRIVALRCPLIYGSGVKANFAKLVKLVGSGIPLPFGSVTDKRSYLARANLTSCIVALALSPMTVWDANNRRAFELCDGQSLTLGALCQEIGARLGRNTTLLNIPPSLLRAGMTIAGKRTMANSMLAPLEVSNTAIVSAFDWVPPYSFPETLDYLSELKSGKITRSHQS